MDEEEHEYKCLKHYAEEQSRFTNVHFKLLESMVIKSNPVHFTWKSQQNNVDSTFKIQAIFFNLY